MNSIVGSSSLVRIRLLLQLFFVSWLLNSNLEIQAETPAAEHDSHSHIGHGHDHDEHFHSEHDHTHAEHDHAEETGESVSQVVGQQLAIYSLLIAASSLLGGWLPSRMQFSHLQFQRLLSIVGGMLLGIGVFHLFPHAIHELGADHVDYVANWMMGGVVMMFFLLRTFHVHHHEPPATIEADEESPGSIVTESTHQHSESCSHGHDHGGSNLGWTGMFFGLSVHTLLDGLALGASMQADAHHATGGWLGLGVLAGIVLHKPLDSLSITTLMINANQPTWRRMIVNLVYCLLCPIGAALFVWGVRVAGGETTFIVGAGLAFSAGIFLCIALADLLPEMEFHSHNRWQLSACLTLGIVLAWAIRFLEPAHLHH